jgi:hypothetical protein
MVITTGARPTFTRRSGDLNHFLFPYVSNIPEKAGANLLKMV